MGKILHTKHVSYVKGDLDIKIDLYRFEKQFGDAQYWLDSQVMNDMVPLMPHRDGIFVDLTRAQSAAIAGIGEVVAAAPPFGRFLYMGKVMVDPLTRSPWARKGVKKVVTDRPLTYGNPQAVPQWFEAAKDKHLDEWVDGVKKRAGGGEP